VRLLDLAVEVAGQHLHILPGVVAVVADAGHGHTSQDVQGGALHHHVVPPVIDRRQDLLFQLEVGPDALLDRPLDDLITGEHLGLPIDRPRLRGVADHPVDPTELVAVAGRGIVQDGEPTLQGEVVLADEAGDLFPLVPLLRVVAGVLLLGATVLVLHGEPPAAVGHDLHVLRSTDLEDVVHAIHVDGVILGHVLVRVEVLPGQGDRLIQGSSARLTIQAPVGPPIRGSVEDCKCIDHGVLQPVNSGT